VSGALGRWMTLKPGEVGKKKQKKGKEKKEILKQGLFQFPFQIRKNKTDGKKEEKGKEKKTEEKKNHVKMKNLGGGGPKRLKAQKGDEEGVGGWQRFVSYFPGAQGGG